MRTVPKKKLTEISILKRSESFLYPGNILIYTKMVFQRKKMERNEIRWATPGGGGGGRERKGTAGFGETPSSWIKSHITEWEWKKIFLGKGQDGGNDTGKLEIYQFNWFSRRVLSRRNRKYPRVAGGASTNRFGHRGRVYILAEMTFSEFSRLIPQHRLRSSVRAASNITF